MKIITIFHSRNKKNNRRCAHIIVACLRHADSVCARPTPHGTHFVRFVWGY